MRIPIYVAMAAAIVGCAENRYFYAPESANTMAAGMPATRTPIPQEAPQGAIDVTSYGTTKLPQGDARIPALHVRLIVTNDGDDQPWRLDTRQQLVEIPGEGRSAPMFVNSDARDLPMVDIARHERRTIDLYYPLPRTMTDIAHLPRFEVLWQVTTPAREVASRTHFDRVQQDRVAYYDDGGWPLWGAYGTYWWHDSRSPRFVFVHSRHVAFRDHRGHGRHR